MNHSAADPISSHPVRLIRQHGALLRQLCRRDLAARYRGSRLGLMWMVLTPLLMLLVYSFVFGVVFQARWGQATADGHLAGFAITLYSGLILHQLVAEILARSPSIVLHHASYVKKVVFPLPLLSLMICSTALAGFMVQCGLLLLACLITGVTFHASWLAIPLLVLPLVVVMAGVSWVVASLGVYVRDLDQVMGLFTTMLLFLSPIFYPASSLPEPYQSWLYLNPLTPLIGAFRAAVFEGHWPHWQGVVVAWAGAALIAQMGYGWFIKTRKGFNDVL